MMAVVMVMMAVMVVVMVVMVVVVVMGFTVFASRLNNATKFYEREREVGTKRSAKNLSTKHSQLC